MTPRYVWIVAWATMVVPVLGAPSRHRPHAPLVRAAPEHPAFEFYPERIEGGVSGNLPFNNQIRKLRDPLNANGAGG